MITESLLKFIQEQTDLGVLQEDIIKSLVGEGGWSPEDVNEAFLTVSQNQIPSSEEGALEADEVHTSVVSSNSRFTLKSLLFSLAVVIVLSGTATGFYFYLSAAIDSQADSVGTSSPEEAAIAQNTPYKTDDVKRLEDLVYWTGLIEDYHDKTGEYPFQAGLESGEIILVRIANSKQEEHFDPISDKFQESYEENMSSTFTIKKSEEFIDEMKAVLEPGIDTPYDPEDYLEGDVVWYNYFATNDGYVMWVTCRTCGVTKISTLLLSESYTPTVNIASPLMVDKVTKALTREEMMNHPTFMDWLDPGFAGRNDLQRVNDLVYWTGLIEEYYEKKGHYPLQDRIEDNILTVRVVNDQQAEYLDPSSSKYGQYNIEAHEGVVNVTTEDFIAELHEGLERKFDVRFDPQETLTETFIWYVYSVSDVGYVMTVSCSLCHSSEISYTMQAADWPTVVSIASLGLAKDFQNVSTREEFKNHPTYKIWIDKELPVVNHVEPPINEPVTLDGWGPIKIGKDRTEIEKQIGPTVRDGSNVLGRDYVNYPEDGVLLIYDTKENILIEIIFHSDHEMTSGDATKKFMGTFSEGFDFSSTVAEVKHLFGEPLSENDQSNYIKILKYKDIEFSFYSGEITEITIIDPDAPTREYFRKQVQKADVIYNPTLSLDGWGDIKLGSKRSVVESILGVEKVQMGNYYASRPDVSIRYSEIDDTVVRIFIISERISPSGGRVRIDPPIKFANGLGFYEATIDDIVDLYGKPDRRTDDEFAGTTLFYGTVTITFTDSYASGFTTNVPGKFGVK